METLLIRNCEFMKIPIDTFFDKWTDVSNWNAWDINLRSAWMFGVFKSGGQGKLMLANRMQFNFNILWVIPDYGYAYTIPLLTATLHFRRLMEPGDHGVHVMHELRYSGVRVFNGRLLKTMMRNNLQSLIKLKCLLEESHFRNSISSIDNSPIAKAS